MKTITFLIIIFLSFNTNTVGEEFPCNKKYDRYFRKYSKRFFGKSFDWRWFKAQAIVESNLRPRSKSTQRAKGIMQLVPSTLREVGRNYPKLRSCIYCPKWNIAAGIAYNRHLWKKWKKISFFHNRLRFTFASYNAGYSTIRQAQKICKQKNLDVEQWTSIEEVASLVKGWNHQQTLAYIKDIYNIHKNFTRKGCINTAKNDSCKENEMLVCNQTMSLILLLCEKRGRGYKPIEL